MIESPRKQKNPLLDLLVFGHVAQLESIKPFRCSEEDDGKKIPCPGLALRYLNTLYATSRCIWADLSMN